MNGEWRTEVNRQRFSSSEYVFRQKCDRLPGQLRLGMRIELLPCDYNDGNVARTGGRLQLGQRFETAHLRHIQIEENDIGPQIMSLLKALQSGSGFDDPIRAVEQLAEQITGDIFIVNQQQRPLRLGRGGRPGGAIFPGAISTRNPRGKTRSNARLAVDLDGPAEQFR